MRTVRSRMFSCIVRLLTALTASPTLELSATKNRTRRYLKPLCAASAFPPLRVCIPETSARLIMPVPRMQECNVCCSMYQARIEMQVCRELSRSMSWSGLSAATKNTSSLTLARIERPIFCEKLHAKSFAAALVYHLVAVRVVAHELLTLLVPEIVRLLLPYPLRLILGLH